MTQGKRRRSGRRSGRLMLAILAALGLLASVIVALVAADRAEAFPTESRCGNQPGELPVNGFISHDQLRQRLAQIEQSTQGRVDVEVAGESFAGREIWSARVGHGDRVVLVQSDIHGNEKHGTIALLDILRTLGNNSQRSQEIREEITFVGIPMMNPDGSELNRRQNFMTWDDVISVNPQLEGVPANPGAWYHSTALNGFDVNRDFNPDLDFVVSPSDLPGNSTQFGFYLTPAARTVRDVYRSLEDEHGKVDVFVDLHNQQPCVQAGDVLPILVTVDEPSEAAGTFQATGANFAPDVTRQGISGEFALVNDGSANPTEGCNPLIDFPEGAIALVDRGTCPFTQKAGNAQDAGASAMVVVNNVPTGPFTMGGTDPSITIPSAMMWQDEGNAIKDALPASGSVAQNTEKTFWSPLSISGRFITDPASLGDFPEFDDDASRRANVAVYDALQNGNSPFGKLTLFPQPPATNLPGTALGSFALRGSAAVLFETSGQTQQVGQKRIGMLAHQVERGLMGIVDTLADGTFDDIDPDRYGDIPTR